MTVDAAELGDSGQRNVNLMKRASGQEKTGEKCHYLTAARKVYIMGKAENMQTTLQEFILPRNKLATVLKTKE